MVFSLSNRAVRLGFLAAALLCFARLSFFSIRAAFATHDLDLNTLAGFQRAAHLEPLDPQNWYLLGRFLQYNLDNPDIPAAIQAYRKALSLNPLSADAWLDLGTAYEGQDDLASARDAFLQGRRVYPLSADVSWRYGNFLLRQGELPQAFAQIKSAVYVDPLRAPEAFSRCWRVDPDINAILNDVLPPRTDVYLSVIHELDSENQVTPALVVWDRLAGLHKHINLRDAFEMTNLLNRAHRIADIQHVWDQAVQLSGTPPPPDPPDSVVWDGGFETGAEGGPMAWVFPSNKWGARIGFDRGEKHSGKQSLRVVFDGRHNADISGICHIALVHPGTKYTFSAWVRTQSITTDQGMRFLLSTQDNTPPGVVETQDFRGTLPWTQISVPWTAGPGVDEFSVCIIRRQSQHFDNQIAGTTWIDDVTLIPASSEPGPR